MVKTREDSRIEVWSNQYINNPKYREDKDRDMVIIQMEHGKHNDYIVEVAPKNIDNQTGALKETICDIEKELRNSFGRNTYKTKEGIEIETDVHYLQDWFEVYKEILCKRYSENKVPDHYRDNIDDAGSASKLF